VKSRFSFFLLLLFFYSPVCLADLWVFNPSTKSKFKEVLAHSQVGESERNALKDQIEREAKKRGHESKGVFYWSYNETYHIPVQCIDRSSNHAMQLIMGHFYTAQSDESYKRGGLAQGLERFTFPKAVYGICEISPVLGRLNRSTIEEFEFSIKPVIKGEKIDKAVSVSKIKNPKKLEALSGFLKIWDDFEQIQNEVLTYNKANGISIKGKPLAWLIENPIDYLDKINQESEIKVQEIESEYKKIRDTLADEKEIEELNWYRAAMIWRIRLVQAQNFYALYQEILDRCERKGKYANPEQLTLLVAQSKTQTENDLYLSDRPQVFETQKIQDVAELLDSEGMYRVREGDSLSKIAKRFYGRATNKEIQNIKKANSQIRGDVVFVGTFIKIPFNEVKL